MYFMNTETYDQVPLTEDQVGEAKSFLPEKNLHMGGVPKRSAFIVDSAGVIQYAESNDNPGEMPNFEAIKAKLKDLG